MCFPVMVAVFSGLTVFHGQIIKRQITVQKCWLNCYPDIYLENSIVSEISWGLKVELDSGIPTGGLVEQRIST